jgi:hypothetical protein
MAGRPVGTMFVELDLDSTKYTKAQKEILAGAEQNSADINKAFKAVGTQSDIIYNAMRQNILNNLNAIKASHLTSADEIRRAQEGAAKQIKKIDDEQYGYTKTMADKTKEVWVAATDAILSSAKKTGEVVYSDLKKAAAGVYDDLKNKLGEYASATGEYLKGMAEKAVIWGAAWYAFGTSAATAVASIFTGIGILIVAYNALDFAIGLVTGKSYKSENIDALIAEAAAITALSLVMRTSVGDAQAMSTAMIKMGGDVKSIEAVYDGVRAAVQTNTEELTRLGVAYKDADGQMLTTRVILSNTKTVLEEYTEGWDRNKAAASLAMGSYEQISAVLKVTDSELQKARESLNAYNLGIGTETKAAVSAYQSAMTSFNAESKLLSDGISRAISDQIMPAFTALAEWFTGSWPTAVGAFRYTMASITSLLWGFSTSVSIVISLVKGLAETLAGGWSNIGKNLSAMWQNIVDDSTRAANAMKLAWAFDDKSGAGQAELGKTWDSAAAAAARLATEAKGVAAAEKEAAVAAKEAEKEHVILMKAMTDMIPIIAKLGEEKLKFASIDYTESLKKEGVTIAQMEASLGTYLKTLEQVYTTRIDGENRIAEMMKNTGGKPEEVMKAQLEALKQEEKYLADKLAAHKAHYDALAAQHAKATDAMKTKTAELAKLESDASAQRQGHANTMMGLQEKLLLAQGKAATDQEIYNMKLKSIEDARAAANQLQGEAQIKALEAVKSKYAELTSEVTKQGDVYDQTSGRYVKANVAIQTSEESVKIAMDNVKSVQKEIEDATRKVIRAKEDEVSATKKWQDETKTAMDAAQKEVGDYKQKIVELSNAISNMEKSIAISVIDNATSVISGIIAELQRLTSTPWIITIQTNQVDGGGGKPSPAPGADPIPTPSPGPEAYAMGLDFVPYDNFPAILHMGETVLTRSEATAYREAKGESKGGGQVINFNPSINILSANKSPEQLAREIVKPLQNEMRRLSTVN